MRKSELYSSTKIKLLRKIQKSVSWTLLKILRIKWRWRKSGIVKLMCSLQAALLYYWIASIYIAHLYVVYAKRQHISFLKLILMYLEKAWLYCGYAFSNLFLSCWLFQHISEWILLDNPVKTIDICVADARFLSLFFLPLNFLQICYHFF